MLSFPASSRSCVSGRSPAVWRRQDPEYTRLARGVLPGTCVYPGPGLPRTWVCWVPGIPGFTFGTQSARNLDSSRHAAGPRPRGPGSSLLQMHMTAEAQRSGAVNILRGAYKPLGPGIVSFSSGEGGWGGGLPGGAWGARFLHRLHLSPIPPPHPPDRGGWQSLMRPSRAAAGDFSCWSQNRLGTGLMPGRPLEI